MSGIYASPRPTPNFYLDLLFLVSPLPLLSLSRSIRIPPPAFSPHRGALSQRGRWLRLLRVSVEGPWGPGCSSTTHSGAVCSPTDWSQQDSTGSWGHRRPFCLLLSVSCNTHILTSPVIDSSPHIYWGYTGICFPTTGL